MEQIITYMIEEYYNKLPSYQSMQDYNDGKHDIIKNYTSLEGHSNEKPIVNFIGAFIQEERQYALGNPLTYTSYSNNEAIIKAIVDETYHWRESQDAEIMTRLEIFGKCYLLWYIDERDGKQRFNEKILDPTNCITYQDDTGKVIYLIHFYKKQFDNSQYYDVYFPDGHVESYKDGAFLISRKLIFDDVPAFVVKLDNENDTIYNKIKSLQDAYNHVLADSTNIIGDYRTAILKIVGIEIPDEKIPEVEQKLLKRSILNYGEGVSVEWLIKNVQDTYIENTLERLKQSMLFSVSHPDANEKLQSNVSGLAIRSRLIFLEQRCDNILSVVIDAVYERVMRLFKYIALKTNVIYDIRDIKITGTPNVPTDDAAMINALNQLGIGRNVSLKTTLSQLSFIDNPEAEMENIKAEQADSIDLDMIGGEDE